MSFRLTCVVPSSHKICGEVIECWLTNCMLNEAVTAPIQQEGREGVYHNKLFNNFCRKCHQGKHSERADSASLCSMK